MAQQEFINNFNGGMYKDTSLIYQPDGTYRHMKNFDVVSHDGQNFSVQDALGNRLIFEIPRGYSSSSPVTYETPNMPIGFISFPDKLIIFSTNDESANGGYGEIGICYLTNFGQSAQAEDRVLNIGATIGTWTYSGYVPLYRHNNLKFSKRYRIEGFGYKENDAVERVYWTDNFNQPRVFEISSSTFTDYQDDGDLVVGNQYMVLGGIITHNTVDYGPGIGNVFTASNANYTVLADKPLVIPYFNYELIDFTPTRTLGNIYFKEFGSGYKHCGSHMYFYRQIRSGTGYKTGWSYGSFPVHVGRNQATLGGDVPAVAPTVGGNNHDYVGAGNTTSVVESGQSVKLNITNIDTNYDTIELACAEFSQDFEVPYSITIVATKGVNSTTLNSDGSIDMEDFGNVNLGTLTLDDITLFPAIVLKCKTLTTNKNYILAGNISEREEFDDIDFSDATFSDFIYHMPVDVQVDYTLAGQPVFELTNQCAFTPGVNPSVIFPKARYVVTVGTIEYPVASGNLYVAGTANNTFIGISGSGTYTVSVPGSQLRPCFYWDKYNPVNSTDVRRNVIEAKALSGAAGNVELNYRNPVASMHLKSYRSSEKYRFGICFWDKRGNPYYVRWLTDYTFTDIYTKNGLLHDVGPASPYSSVYALTPNGFQIDDLRIPRSVVDKISGFSIVRAECDKSIITQGLLWQCCHSASWGTSTQVRPIPGLQLANISSSSSAGAPSPYVVHSFICPDQLVEFRGFQKGFTGGDKLRVAGWLHPVEFVGSGRYHAWSDNVHNQTWTKLYTHVDASDSSVNEQLITGVSGVTEGGTIVNFIPGYDFYNSHLWFGLNGSGGSELVYDGWWGGATGDWRYGDMVGGKKVAVSFAGDFNNYDKTGLYSEYTLPNTGYYHKALVNYVVEKTNQYGGTGDDAKAATLYISTGHFQPITSQVIADNYVGGTGVTDYDYLRFDGVQIFGGDTFVNMIDQGYGIYNQGYNDGAKEGGVVGPRRSGGLAVFFPCENNVNYDLRRGRKVSDYGLQNNGYGVVYSNPNPNLGLEDYAYNDAYSSDGLPFTYLALPANYKNAGRFPFRIRFAGQKFPGEQVDNFRVFLTNDYKDVDGLLGEINNLRSKEGKTFYLQNHGVGYVPILERQTVSAAAGEVTTLGTGGVVDRFDTISNIYGNQHQWSLIDTSEGFLWFDMRNKSVVLLKGGSVQEITVPLGLKTFFNEVFLERTSLYYGGTYLNSPTYDATSDRPLMGTGITGVYDPKTKTTFLTFKFKEWTQKTNALDVLRSPDQYQVIDKDFTIAFNHQMDKFVGFYDKMPAIWHNHNQFVLSANNPKNLNKYYNSDAYFPFDVEVGDVIKVGNFEYICHTAGSVTGYSDPPDANLFELINQTNEVYVENEEKPFNIEMEGYQRNLFYGRVVNNEVEIVINPKTTEPSVFDNFIVGSNNVNFTDVYVETTDQSASDTNIKSTNRDYQYTDKAWRSSLPLSRTGRIVDYFVKAKFVKKNWTTDPTTVTGSVKIVNFIKTLFRLSR